MRPWWTCVVALAAVMGCGGIPALGADAESAPVRIGIYDSRAVALAWGRSAEHNRQSDALYAAAEKAKAEQDEKKLAVLKRQGGEGQRRLHAQVFSNAPIEDVMAKVKDALPEIAKRKAVVAIMPSVDWKGEGVELVDVTEELVKEFSPDEKTLRYIRQMKGKTPIPIEKLEEMEEAEKASQRQRENR